MKLEGNTHIKAPRAEVYNYFTDAHKVSQCAPGVDKLEVLEKDKKFKIVAGVGFGMIKASFDTVVEFVERRENEFARIKAAGKAPGSNANVTADLILTDAASGGTDVKWVADVVISGTIAAVATRLMGSVTQKLAGEFFNCAKGNIEK
jgi:hypothetical protein